MAICVNCNANLSCGCQRRTASDGTQCCDQCVKAYEAKLVAQAPPPPNPPINRNG